MATITVTNLLDSGTGSLRDAINLANATTTENDLINFDVNGTIELSSGELAISDDLTINGPGANLVSVDANNLFRVFNLDDGTGSLIDVDIEGLTITGGNADFGGGIFNVEDLTVTNSTLSGNTASIDGGGIENSFGTVSVTGSTLLGNTANRDGGGIDNVYGTASVTNSTISGNTASIDGGGIENYYGIVNVTNVTLSGNTASGDGGGIDNFNGTVTVSNSTLSGNTAGFEGGGIYNYFGNATVTSTIIAANTNNNDVGGAFTSRGNNLIGNGDGATGFTQPTDQVGTTDSPINPLLGSLASNGGPTQTQALLPGSPAIDAGSNLLELTTDQRGPGFERTKDGSGDGILITDVGAFEVQQQPPTQVPESDPTFGLLGLAMLGTILLRKRQQQWLLRKV